MPVPRAARACIDPGLALVRFYFPSTVEDVVSAQSCFGMTACSTGCRIVQQCAPARRFRWERSPGASAPPDGAQFAPPRHSLGSAAGNAVKTQSPYSPPTVPLQSPLQSPLGKTAVPLHSLDSEVVWRIPFSLQKIKRYGDYGFSNGDCRGDCRGTVGGL